MDKEILKTILTLQNKFTPEQAENQIKSFEQMGITKGLTEDQIKEFYEIIADGKTSPPSALKKMVFLNSKLHQ